jgi:hypothetical protein
MTFEDEAELKPVASQSCAQRRAAPIVTLEGARAKKKGNVPMHGFIVRAA